MIKLYGVPISNNISKVRYCLNYLGLEYELIPTSPMSGDTQTEEFKAMNPVGKIPAIDIDGFTLFESNTINRYLAASENSSIYPEDLKKRSIIDAWLDYLSIHVSNAQGRVTFNRVFAPFVEAEVDESSLKTGLEFLDKYLPILDEQLSKHKYLAGDEFSLADITLLAILDPFELSQISLDKYESITKWHNALKAEPFYQKCYKDFTPFVQEAMSAMAK